MLADISRLLKDIKIKGDIKNYDDVIDTFGETLLHAASACVNRKGWILDSGASSYTCDQSIFVPSSLKSHTCHVLVGNGQYMSVTGVGDVHTYSEENVPFKFNPNGHSAILLG